MQGTIPENATLYHDVTREIIGNKAGKEGNQYNQHTGPIGRGGGMRVEGREGERKGCLYIYVGVGMCRDRGVSQWDGL